MAQMLGIGESVFFAGVLDTERLIRTYLACDLYAMLSSFDTFGMVVLEAMAASLPVIVSANVGARDLVSQGVNGYVIERADRPDEVAGAIGALLDDEQRRQQMGREALRIAQMHTWEAAAARMAEIYERLLHEKARP
jgi:UDP-glucose:(heptosyl)LPS alpha-1,3-glucosyltransferase